jgi:hypothetical protein
MSSVLTYRIEQFSRSGYGQVTIRIQRFREESVADTLEGTIGNRDGYGSQGAADSVANRCRYMLEHGIDTEFCTSFEPIDLTLRWQEFDHNGSAAGYCDMSVEDTGFDGYRSLDNAHKILRKIGRSILRATYPGERRGVSDIGSWTFKNPAKVEQALIRMGAVRIEGMQTPPGYCPALVRYEGPSFEWRESKY